MSIGDPISLSVTVHGEDRTIEGARRTALRILSAGLREISTPLPAVPDGSPILSAQMRLHRVDTYFPGSAPVQAEVTLSVNLADVISIKVHRKPIAQSNLTKKLGALNIFPRSEESDDPLAFTWLGTSFYLFLNVVARFAHRVREQLYIRYGGRMPGSLGTRRHVHRRLARPLRGTVSIDIQKSEQLRFVATLGSGELFVATVTAMMPFESSAQLASPAKAADAYHLPGVTPVSRAALRPGGRSRPPTPPTLHTPVMTIALAARFRRLTRRHFPLLPAPTFDGSLRVRLKSFSPAPKAPGLVSVKRRRLTFLMWLRTTPWR